MTSGKTIALIICTFVGKVIYLLFNKLSRFVIAFLPRSKHLLISPSAMILGSQRVRHDRVTSLSLFTFIHWRRKWQLTPVFLPGESQGLGSLVGSRLWGRTELDVTDVT